MKVDLVADLGLALTVDGMQRTLFGCYGPDGHVWNDTNAWLCPLTWAASFDFKFGRSCITYFNCSQRNPALQCPRGRLVAFGTISEDLRVSHSQLVDRHCDPSPHW